MNDQNDDLQNFALMVLAGVVGLVIAGVIGLAIGTTTRTTTGTSMHRTSATGAARPDMSTSVAGAADGRIYFELDADKLPDDAQSELMRVADLARADTNKVVLISGFHDASGDATHNADLAKRRAQVVQHALEANGVAADHLVLDKPAVATGGADAREARRVEMRVR